jgi:hypothetical protein
MRDVKLAKFASLLLVPVFAILLAGAARPPTTEATARDVITLNPSACLALSASNWVDSTTGLLTCIALNGEDNLDLLAQVLRQADELPKDLTPEDFAPVDQDGGQLHEKDGTLFIVAFVSNDDPVAFFADKGIFNESGGGEAFCGPPEPSFDFQDEDCNDNGIKGDGVVVATLTAGGGLDEGDRGEAEVRVRQDNIELGEPYVVVGEPHRIEITPSKTVIQTGLDVSDKYDGILVSPDGSAAPAATGTPRCDMFDDTASFLNALRSPEITPITAKVLDDDGTQLAAAWTAWTISNEDSAAVALPDAPALDLSGAGLGIVAPNVLCGLTEAGEITLTGRIVVGPQTDPENNPDARAGLDPQAADKDAEVELTVKDPPTSMALSASPASLACDGVNSSTISAALTDADGENAVNGNRVHWETKALGTVNPLESGTGDGVATTVLTPLDGVTGGVVTRAWLKLPVPFADDEGVPELDFGPGNDFNTAVWKALEYPPIQIERTDLENTTLVACEGTAAEQPGLQPGGQPPVIAPPSTGSGGSSGDQAWLALPLAAGALIVIGTGLALKRRAG